MKTKYHKLIAVLAVTGSLFSISTGLGAWQAHDEPKRTALSILENKCNVCHRSQNPGRMFTWNNMENNAARIYKQVFVKKRMPRGNAIRLTDEERQALMDWLKTQNIAGD